MVIINCTQKLLRRSRIGKTTDVPDSTNALGAWCANNFYLGRFPYVLLTNEKTLLSTVFSCREFKNLSAVLCASLHRQLLELEIPMEIVAGEIDHCSKVYFGSDTKRSVLGSMNDLVFQIKTIVALDEAFDNVMLERSLRKTPFSALRYNSPERAVKDFLGKALINQERKKEE